MKVIKEKDKTTYVVFLLDDSGSMFGVREETLSGFNDQLEMVTRMQAPDHDVIVSFMTFAEPTHIKVLRRWVKADQVKPLTLDEYLAKGASTALYDGMQDAIDLAKEKQDEISKGKNAALVLFFTDGGENSSKRVRDGAILKEQIEALKATDRWTFTFMGTEEDVAIQKKYGIDAGNTKKWEYGAAGSVANSFSTTSGLVSYAKSRAEGKTSLNNFYVEPKKEEEKDTEEK